MQANSITEVTRFMTNLAGDAAMRQRFAALEDNGAVLSMARSMGFEFSEAEYETYLDSVLVGLDDAPGTARMSGPSQCPSKWPT